MTNEERERAAELRGLIDAYGSNLMLFVNRRERNLMEAEEIWADVFGLAYLHLDALAELSPQQRHSWLFRTARQLGANRYRRAASRTRLYERLEREPLPFVASPEDDVVALDETLVDVERSARIRTAIAMLPADHQRVLILHAIGYKGPAIAAELGVSPGTARKRLMKSRAAFRLAFEAQLMNDVCPNEGSES